MGTYSKQDKNNTSNVRILFTKKNCEVITQFDTKYIFVA